MTKVSKINTSTVLFPVAVARGIQSTATTNLHRLRCCHGVVHRRFGIGGGRRCGVA